MVGSSAALLVLFAAAGAAGARLPTAPTSRLPAVRRAGVARMVDTMQETAIRAAANAAIAAAERDTGDVRAPEASKTYVSLDKSTNVLTDEGLPEVYDAAMIETYWRGQGPALRQRWTEFLGISIPFITRLATIGLSSGLGGLEREAGPLAKEARQHMERLGPTYIKLGQMMSVRPDVLPQAAMDELQILQDSVRQFATPTAYAIIEKELGRPLDEVFSHISAEPVAAASLAQVYKATLLEGGQTVAVKVQRPGVLETVSKDLYVLRRAAEVFQNLSERITPNQRTSYTALLNEWAIGFYTELDFTNEGRNQMRLRQLLDEKGVRGVLVPAVYEAYSTRRLLVSEWVDGTKLSDLPQPEIAALVAVGQEAFLTQLLEFGVFHADPHPGNLLRINSPREDGKVLALLDFGLVAQVKQEDRDTMISALIHLANKDYTSLVEDFVGLGILPQDSNRKAIIPLMDKALTPYIQGGGASKYAQSVLDSSGGFQSMTQDMLTVLNEVPFTIPPYFALLARAIVTLEGIALTGNPDYALVLEAYPFIARRLLADDRPAVQRALQEALYGSAGKADGGGLNSNRIAVLLNSALGVVQRDGMAVDLDKVPDESVDAAAALAYVLSPGASSLRALLEREADVAADLILRQTIRRATSAFDARASAATFGLLGGLLPSPLDVPGPLYLPDEHGAVSAAGLPAFLRPREVFEALAPKLSQGEELYLLSLADLAAELLGPDAAAIVNGDAASSDTLAVPRLALDLVEGLGGRGAAHAAAAASRAAPGGGAVARGEGAFPAPPAALVSAARQLLGRTRRKAAAAAAGADGATADPAGGLLGAFEGLSPAERAVLEGSFQRLNAHTYAAACKRLAALRG